MVGVSVWDVLLARGLSQVAGSAQASDEGIMPWHALANLWSWELSFVLFLLGSFVVVFLVHPLVVVGSLVFFSKVVFPFGSSVWVCRFRYVAWDLWIQVLVVWIVGLVSSFCILVWHLLVWTVFVRLSRDYFSWTMSSEPFRLG